MYAGYLALGSQEIINNRRAAAHIENGICARGVELVHDDSWRYTHAWLGDDDYETPAGTGAPWVQEGRPESLEFGGVWGLNIEGLETGAVEQDVLEGVLDGGSAGYRRLPTRKITVEALLSAQSARGLQWGLRWLNRALLSDGCELGAEPRDLTFLESAPEYEQRGREADWARAGADRTRQVTSVVVTQLPEVQETFGSSVLRGEAGGTMARVEFELTALVPLIWSAPVALLEEQRLALGEELTTRFTELDEDGNCPALCSQDEGVLLDPDQGGLWSLPRPAAPGAVLGCRPLESRRSLYTVPEGLVPLAGEMRPTVEVRAGARDERNIRIRWARGKVYDDGAGLDCATVGEAMVSYLPAGAVLTLDGRSGRAWAATRGGEILDATTVVVGRAGAPWRAPRMTCGAPYTVVVDAEPETDARVQITGVTGEV